MPEPFDTPLDPGKESQRSCVALGNGAGNGPLSLAVENADAQPLLDMVLANAPIVLWAVDADGLFTMSTGQGLSVLGLKPVLGRSVFDLYQDFPKILADVRQAFLGEEFRSTVEIEQLYYDSWYSPIRNNRGVVVGVRGVATVITQQVRAETALRESEERFAKAFHSSPLGILFTELSDGVFIDVNQAFLKMTGFSRDEIVGQSVVELELWDDPQERDQFVQTLRHQGSVRNEEYRFRSRNGDVTTARVSADVVELDGRSCILSLCEDVTEQKRAELAYRESQQRYETLARIAPVGIFHTNADGDTLYVNEHWCSVTGLSLDEVRQDGWANAVFPQDRQRVMRDWQTAVAAGQPFHSEFRFQRPDRVVTWVLGRAEPERNATGDVTSYVGTITAINDRKQIEETQRKLNIELENRIVQRTDQLKRVDLTLQEQIHQRTLILEDLMQSQARWQSVVEDAPDRILIVDRKGTITYINHTLSSLEKADVEGRPVFDFIPEEFRARAREIIDSVFATGEPVNDESIAWGPQRTQARYSNRIGPVIRDETVIAATIVSRDVTEQKRVEEEAHRRQQELAHAGRLNVMGEMAAALAHQLNQPLSAIANYAAGCVLRLQSGHVEKEEMITAARDIGRQADRAGNTIRRILDFVRKRDVHIRRVDPQELTSAAVELALPEARRQGVRIVVETSDSLPDIMGDQIQLEQVLLNLLVNAVEAVRETSANRSLIIVRTSASADGYVQVSVCDQGSGLPDNFEDWIFEPFHTTKPRGTGMGLSISRSILQAHHGRLWAVPNEKQGATFYASFPPWPEGETDGR